MSTATTVRFSMGSSLEQGLHRELGTLMPISLQFGEESIPPMNLTKSPQTAVGLRRLLPCSTDPWIQA